MDRPKAFIELDGLYLIQRALNASSGVTDRLLIVAVERESFVEFSLALDAYPGLGPLAKAGARAAAPRIDGRLQPFPSVYPPAGFSIAEAGLRRGDLRLDGILGELGPAELSEDKCRALDPELLSFVNINRPEELEAAFALIRSGAAGA